MFAQTVIRPDLGAPAGYGKTLLLSDWAGSSTNADTAWVTLDRDENDPRRLWASVVASAAGCPSVPPSSRLHAPWTWRPGAQPEFLAELLEALSALPRQIRLVLAGRLWELCADRMSFTVAEAAALLANSRVLLTPAQVEVLHQRTGGWAAGLRLAADALIVAVDRNGFLDRFSGDERSVADYLVGEVLSELPDDTLEFMRMISVTDPVSATLAVELSGREDAGSLLDRLEHETSLVSATDWRRDAYRVPELLRTYLLGDLRR